MIYKEVMLKATVKGKDVDLLTQALNDAMDKLENETTVFASAIEERKVEMPENAAAIGMQADWHLLAVQHLRPLIADVADLGMGMVKPQLV